MGHYKLGFKTFVFTLIITTLFTSCSENAKSNFYIALDMIGLLNPREPRISLSLDKQNIEEPFSFSDYCKEEYDSIFLVYPYFNIEREDFVRLKMSDVLRRKCDNNTMFDSFSTLLFINNGTVKAYSIVGVEEARITPYKISENNSVFPFKQKFTLDDNRYIQLYKE